MRRRTLGDATVASVGAGDVSLSRAAARGIDAAAVERALHDAIEAGIDVVDVASDAERLAGDAVREQRARDRVVITSRVALLAAAPGRPRDVLPERLPAGYVQQHVESTLRATRLDALPLAILPLRTEWRDSSAWAELAATCARLVREGKVMQWGVALGAEAARTIEVVVAPKPAIIGLVEEIAPPAPPPPVIAGQRIIDEDWLVCVDVRFNLCDRTMAPVIAAAVDKKRAVLAREPLAGGALAGYLGPGVKLSIRDDRHGIDLERIAIAVAKLSRFVKREPPAARSSEGATQIVETTPRVRDVEGDTVAELALRYVIDREAIAMPRLHRRDFIADALVAAAAKPLSSDTILRTEQIFSTTDP
jgi:aryl-alcohol dehydrogenase-like predicted oxidoreductase